MSRNPPFAKFTCDIQDSQFRKLQKRRRVYRMNVIPRQIQHFQVDQLIKLMSLQHRDLVVMQMEHFEMSQPVEGVIFDALNLAIVQVERRHPGPSNQRVFRHGRQHY